MQDMIENNVNNVDDARNLVINSIQSIAKNGGMVIGASAVVKYFAAGIFFFENQASLFVGKQISVIETRKNFKKIIAGLEVGFSPKVRNSVNFLKRVHHLKESEQKYIFMSMVVSKYQNDVVIAIDLFSDMEEKIIKDYFNGIGSQLYS